MLVVRRLLALALCNLEREAGCWCKGSKERSFANWFFCRMYCPRLVWVWRGIAEEPGSSLPLERKLFPTAPPSLKHVIFTPGIFEAFAPAVLGIIAWQTILRRSPISLLEKSPPTRSCTINQGVQTLA